MNDPATLCTYVLQLVIMRADGSVDHVEREGTSIEHDAEDTSDVAVQILIEQAALLHREVTGCDQKSSGAALSRLQSLSEACDTDLPMN
jgi:hypothetical protein